MLSVEIQWHKTRIFDLTAFVYDGSSDLRQQNKARKRNRPLGLIRILRKTQDTKLI